MGTLLTTGSILAAFFAGAVALFSPCCVVFLFPAYLASAVKNRRWTLLPLTFVFALGLAAVLLPVTLGVSLVMASVRRFHTPLYVAGGLLMLALAVLSLLGRSWSLPRFVRTPDVERGDTASVFALGAFSGVASSCCAPVMAGVMALSALAGTTIGAASLGLAYVFGMVFPLFLMALLWDRFKLGQRRLFQAKPVRLRILGRVVNTNTMNVAVAIGFGLMGGFVLFLAANGNTTGAPGFQLAIGRWLTSASRDVLRWLDPVPEPILGLGLLALAALFFVAAVRGKKEAPSVDSPLEDRHEHEDGEEEASSLAVEREPAGTTPSCH
ncbi:MAG: cytochrome C biogenesis protein [Actinobacteria bacterium RBG_19FT_COMBO_70_19]|nr:MAG: cytochrome C biogenesis protein [Actinobacteria bacterium RBG_19FT_COMBO_70_19]